MVKSETIGRLSTSEGASVNFLSTREHIPVVQLQALQLMFVCLPVTMKYKGLRTRIVYPVL